MAKMSKTKSVYNHTILVVLRSRNKNMIQYMLSYVLMPLFCILFYSVYFSHLFPMDYILVLRLSALFSFARSYSLPSSPPRAHTHCTLLLLKLILTALFSFSSICNYSLIRFSSFSNSFYLNW